MENASSDLSELYGASIQEFLENSDLSTISAKKVRKYIQEKHSIDIESIKKDLNALIELQFVKLQSKEESELSDLIEDGRVRKAARTNTNDKKISKRKTTKKVNKKENKKERKEPTGPKKLNGFTAPYKLKPKLKELLQEDMLPRTGVVKQLWAYIKSNKLQDPKDGRNIICDESLKNIFKLDSFTSFQMSKLIGEHLIKLTPEELQKVQQELDKQYYENNPQNEIEGIEQELAKEKNENIVEQIKVENGNLKVEHDDSDINNQNSNINENKDTVESNPVIN